MENKCPKCGEEYEYTFENDVSQDGDDLFISYWCKCKSCGKNWQYVEMYHFCDAWIETEEED